MKLNFKLWAMTAVALFAMNSCTQEEEIITGGEQKGTPVNFDFGIGAVTKTAMNDSYETSFIADDAVGIFQVDPNTNVVLASGKYVYDGTNWNVGEGSTAITAVEGEEYMYYAYYPYKEEEVTTYTNVPITVALSQVAGIEANDALMTNCRTSSSQVELGFKHAFALVQVNLTGTMAAPDAIVTLKNIYPQCTLDLTDFIVGDATGTASDIVMWQHATNKGVYRAIVPAQTITATNALLDISSNGKNYRFTWDADVKYEIGKLRVINVTLGETPEEIEISIPASDTTIDTWGNSETTLGSGNYEEIIDYVETVELQFTDGITFTDVTGNWTSAPINFKPEEITWYQRKASADESRTTPTISSGTLTLSNTTTNRAQWTSAGIICHYPGYFNKDALYLVELSLTVGANGILGVTISTSDDSRRFHMYNDETNSKNWVRNVTTFNATNNVSFYINMSEASASGNSSNNAPDDPFAATTEADVSDGINITFFDYTDVAKNGSSSVTINSFKMTRVAE